ncbi:MULTISPECIES: hypothetical protein [Nostoc]|uniref:Uncharacterized protein n=2 Tax=Nostoc TaxID=1177 RepID=A0ABR8I9I2_9NOSO|nr:MULTISPECIES: hypothetical protein [Nostoc]MBD2562690.1 hypothetical protein [Nostoc linckia FACHB-391]MBD2647728.1 hypothetical protein [Nostoc foliaceum FACHB-393]
MQRNFHCLNTTLPDLLTGYRVKILDSNAIASKHLCNRCIGFRGVQMMYASTNVSVAGI